MTELSMTELNKKFREELIAYFLLNDMDHIENEQIKGIHRHTETQQVDHISFLTEIRGEDIQTRTHRQTDRQQVIS
jgi:hypothetical protein